MNRDQEQSRHEHFMRLALELAKKGLVAGELPIGSVLVMKNDVIAEAYCSEKRERMLAHAELLALIKADMKHPTVKQRRQMTLYTNLEPCVMCLGAAMSFCVGTIVYGINAPADGAVTRLSDVSFGDSTYPDYHMPTIIRGALADESRSLFQLFVEKSSDRAMVSFSRGVLGSDSYAGKAAATLSYGSER
jgi:tRNA(adenine34) deaminase